MTAKHDSKSDSNWLADYGAVLAALAALAVLFALVASLTQPALTPQTQTPSPNAKQHAVTVTNATVQPMISTSVSPQTAAQAIALASASANARAFLARNASANAVFLNPAKLAELAKKYPVVYANLGDEAAERYGVFEVQFSAGGQGLLVLVGADAGGAPTRVLREFPVVGLNVG